MPPGFTSSLNASHFSLPDNTLHVGATGEESEVLLVLSVFCNLGESSDKVESLTLMDLKGYSESSELLDSPPDLSRAQSHTVQNMSPDDFSVPIMMRGASVFESGQTCSRREMIELPLQAVKQDRVADQSYNFFIPLASSYFDGCFEIHGALLWCGKSDGTSDDIFHFTLQLPNSYHKHIAQVAFGAIVAPHTHPATVAQGLLACIHPLVSDIMQSNLIGRTCCYSDSMWLVHSLVSYFQHPTSAFPTLRQQEALTALVRHVHSVSQREHQHSPLYLASISVILNLLSEAKDSPPSNHDSVSALCDLAGSFFQPAHQELLKQLCDVSSDQGGRKALFLQSDHFFEYFRSIRQSLLFLLASDGEGDELASQPYPSFAPLAHVLPLLLRSKIATVQVAELYRPELETMVKAHIDGVERFMVEDLWRKLHAARFVAGVRGFPSGVVVPSMLPAQSLVNLLADTQFISGDEASAGHVVELEISKVQQYLEEGPISSADKDFLNNLISSTFIRKLRLFQSCFMSITRHVADFSSFAEIYNRQCTEGALLGNLWSLEQYSAAGKSLLAGTERGLLLLWAGDAMTGQDTVREGSGSSIHQTLTNLALKQPWGLACSSGGAPSLFVTGVNNTLHQLYSHEARTLVANGPGTLLGGLDVAQLRAAKSLCTYSVMSRGVAVTLLVIADTGNHSLRALVLSPKDALGSDDSSGAFPGGRLFELAKINNPVSVCTFQNQLIVASQNDHVIYSVKYEKSKTSKSNKVSGNNTL